MSDEPCVCDTDFTCMAVVHVGLREDIDRAIGEWLKTNFALARASWDRESGHDAMDHLQYLHLSQYEAQLTPKILDLFANLREERS